MNAAPILNARTLEGVSMLKLTSLVACFALAAAAPASAAATQRQNPALALQVLVDRLMQPYVSRHLFRGVIAVAHRGNIDFIRSYGGTVSNKYRIASITKTFTAAAVELLAQRGVLGYGDSLSKFLPSFPNAQNISIEMLLSHTAGLADPDYASFANKTATLDDVVADIASKPPLFSPGKRSQYSNAGYVILAKVVEAASGEPFATFLNREFITPLSLGNTLPDDPHANVPGRLSGFVPVPPPSYAKPVPFEEITAYTGSGNLLSSASDLVRWANAVSSGRIVDFAKLSYPYGWGKRAYLQHQVIEQSGEETGYISYLVQDVTAGVTVVVLSNLEVAPNDRIGKAVYALATLDAPAFPSVFSGTTQSPALGSYNGQYGIFEVTRDGHDYYARWAGQSIGEYLQPLGPRIFYVPQDDSTITIVDAQTLQRQWGSDAPVRFTLIHS